MDWDKLRIFHTVADAGSFTHAGHDLGLSQSAVSRQISALEQDLKVPLFHRHARGLILTEQGEVLYRTAHDVFAKLAATRTRLADSKDKPTGELRVTTTVGLGSVWLTPEDLGVPRALSPGLRHHAARRPRARPGDARGRCRDQAAPADPARPDPAQALHRALPRLCLAGISAPSRHPEGARRSRAAFDPVVRRVAALSVGRQSPRDRRPPRRLAAPLGAQGQQCLRALQGGRGASRHRHAARLSGRARIGAGAGRPAARGAGLRHLFRLSRGAEGVRSASPCSATSSSPRPRSGSIRLHIHSFSAPSPL